MIGIASIDRVTGDSMILPGALDIRELAFGASIQRFGFDGSSGGAPKLNFDDIRITINDQLAVPTLLGKAARGDRIDEVVVTLLSEASQPTLTLTESLITKVEFRPAERAGDPSLVDLFLTANIVKLEIEAVLVGYNLATNSADGACGLTEPVIFAKNLANAPTGALGIPISGFSFGLAKVAPDATGGSGAGKTNLSDVTVEFGPISEAACLLAGVFPNAVSTVVSIDSYSPNGEISTIQLDNARVSRFTLSTTSQGATNVTGSFDYQQVTWTSTDQNGVQKQDTFMR